MSSDSFSKLRMTPHGPLSLRKLVSMKIVDQYSCYVVGLQEEIANQQTLSQYEYFGQFGGITSIRIIQHKLPNEAHIRFDNESSAKAAINWCHNLNINANHGYWKYCIKFITDKICKKSNCCNKHSWCNHNDIIINKNGEMFKFAPVKNNNNGNNNNHNNNYNHHNNLHQQQSATEIVSEKGEQVIMLKSQLIQLQCQYNQQNELIHTLLNQMRSLKAENIELKSYNKSLKEQNYTINNTRNSDDELFNNMFSQSMDEIVNAVITNDDNMFYSNSNSENDTSPELK